MRHIQCSEDVISWKKGRKEDYRYQYPIFESKIKVDEKDQVVWLYNSEKSKIDYTYAYTYKVSLIVSVELLHTFTLLHIVSRYQAIPLQRLKFQ